jgi:hypothetical protein
MKEKRPRGFAAMSIAKRKEIASAGGKRAHAIGKAHQWTSETGSAAGQIGGHHSAIARAAKKAQAAA